MDVLTDLTPAQREAVTHGEGPLLVLAGPGSGKTRVITHRIAHLLEQGVPAWQILAITFTNKAAGEMRERIARLAPGAKVWTSTFHRWCARILRRYSAAVSLEPNFTIYDTDDRRRAIKAATTEVGLDPAHYKPERIEWHISRAKNELVTAEAYVDRSGDFFGDVVAKVYRRYQAKLRESNAVDFDDLLLHVALLLRDSGEIRRELDERFRFVLVDEYQDTNLAQYAIARAISIDYPNLCATGDPDQSIYGWRGADIGNILRFEEDYPAARVVRLEKNYRSTKAILRAAGHLITFNRRRKPKDLFTDNADGGPVQVSLYADEREEARAIAETILNEVSAGRRRYGDFAVFYRVNALSRTIETTLRAAGIPYQMAGGVEFYQRREIKDALAYLRLINNPRDDLSFVRIVNAPPRGIGKKSVELLAAWAEREGLNLFEAAMQADRAPGLKLRAADALKQFATLIDELIESTGMTVEETIKSVLARSGYLEGLVMSEAPEDADRVANLQELFTAAGQYDAQNPDGSLEGFLEETSLVSDVDNVEDGAAAVSLMTLHAAKGLEFPVVFIVALEQGILPHDRSKEDDAELEEERRLLFVGMTRAKQELRLSLTKVRSFRGRTAGAIPSLFITELPDDVHYLDESRLVGVAGLPVRSDRLEAVSGAAAADPLKRVTLNARGAARPAAALMTGAELLNPAEGKSTVGQTFLPARRAARAATNGTAFTAGMLVRHPQYGLGRIVALEGAGDRARATVEFSTAGRRKFVVAQSPLQPVKQP